MSGNNVFGGEEIREESGWRYPLLILSATLFLCVVFLYHYVGPGVDELQGSAPKPTISEEAIQIQVGDVQLRVPANHTIYPRDRRTRSTDQLELYAIWPTMNGYTPARRSEFIDNNPSSRRLDIAIFKKTMDFTEAQRLDLLYLPHVVDKTGQASDYQLTRFIFKEARANAPTNGYANKELFVGKEGDDSLVVLFCYDTNVSEIIPPNCYRELDWTDTVSIRYSFKKEYLADWQEINAQVRRFLQSITVTEQ